MRYVVCLVIASMVLTGCSIGGPPSSAPTTQPDPYFTGESSTLLVRFTLPPEHAGDAAAVRVVRRASRFAPEDPVGHYQLNPGQIDELVLTVPALPAYYVEVVTYDPGTLELGTVGDVHTDVLAGTVTEVTVNLIEPRYRLTNAEWIPSGGRLGSAWLIESLHPLVRADLLFGLNPWNENGIAAVAYANQAPGTRWIWSADRSQHVPEVAANTRLYYQIQLCSEPYLTENGTSFCRYIPDLPHEPLPSIWIRSTSSS